jgi:hypothetical protein
VPGVGAPAEDVVGVDALAHRGRGPAGLGQGGLVDLVEPVEDVVGI